MLSRFVVSQVKHNSYFIVGVMLGLWITLAVVPLEDEAAIVACPIASEAVVDDFEPHREERPLGAAGPAAGRSIQRPRYYTTELGIRGALMAGVLSSTEALQGRAAALNRTAGRLQPLRLFVGAAGASPPRPNVVGFTDSREMLKPFHALKYLADNFLDDYDFFFLVSDASFVNARRLQELVARLGVSRDVCMGAADGDGPYCTLEGGILMSNGVLRAVHPELDWCVRNSYSAQHHENLGRCLLHAAHCRCQPAVAGERYLALRLRPGAPPPAALADAVTAHPVTEPAHFYALHAYAARLFLERDAAQARLLRAQLARGLARAPRGRRAGAGAWPAGLRADPGLPPPPPDSRFDHLRWTWFNETHAAMPDDHRAVGPLPAAHRAALRPVLRAARAWARRAWGPGAGADAALAEGAWRWEPAHALRYRLLLRPQRGPPRLLEVARVLGAARVVAAPYVTEGARLTLLLPLRGPAPLRPARDFLRRADAVLRRDRNVALLVVLLRSRGTNRTEVEELRALLQQRPSRPTLLEVDEPEAEAGAEAEAEAGEDGEARARRAALDAAAGSLPPHALMLLLPPHADFTQDFLNRARMNSIPGVQWFWADGFARHAHYGHPRLAAADGARPHQHTGRFRLGPAEALAVYRADYAAALAAWRGGPRAPAEALLAAAPLRCLRAPEPALVLGPRAPPCGLPAAADAACLRAAAGRELGDRHTLARLLLEDRELPARAARA